MERFHVIEEGCAILISQGHFRQAKIYRRGAEIYAGWGGGYIKLLGMGGTSRPNVTWLDIEGSGVITNGRKPEFATVRVAA